MMARESQWARAHRHEELETAAISLTRCDAEYIHCCVCGLVAVVL